MTATLTAAACAAFLMGIVPAHAGEIETLESIQNEMRVMSAPPQHDWELIDGAWDCDDWARWAMLEIERADLPAQLWYGQTAWGEPHMIVCSGAWCLDRVYAGLSPLSAYDGWMPWPPLSDGL